MKSLLFLALIWLLNLNMLMAQSFVLENKTPFDSKRRESVIDVPHIKDVGWLVYSGDESTRGPKQANLKFTLYDNNLVQKWVVPIDKVSPNELCKLELSINDSGFYYIEKSSTAIKKYTYNKMRITSINWKGERKCFDINKTESFTNNQLGLEKSPDVWTAITTNYKKNEKGEYYTQELLMKSQTVKPQTKLNLPVIDSKVHYPYWIYVGKKNENYFFYTLGIQKPHSQSSIRVFEYSSRNC